MSKKDKAIEYFDLINNDLDNTFLIMCIKALGLSEINKLKDKYSDTIAISDVNNPKQPLFYFEVLGEDLKKNHELLEAEMKRSYINDLYSMAARGSVFLDSLLRDKEKDNPAFSEEIFNEAIKRLNRFIQSKEDKKFLIFFHNVRNCMIHYDGEYNKLIPLEYEFCDSKFIKTEDNVGEQINWSMPALLGLYKNLKRIYNFEYFNQNQFFQQEVG